MIPFCLPSPNEHVTLDKFVCLGAELTSEKSKPVACPMKMNRNTAGPCDGRDCCKEQCSYAG